MIIPTDDPRGYAVRKACEDCGESFDDLSPRRSRKRCDVCRDVRRRTLRAEWQAKEARRG